MTNEQSPSNWQQEFIAKNLTIIGYNAWTGYINSDRGAVICSTNSPAVSVAGETFNCYFVARPNLNAFFNAWLGVPDTTILQRHLTNQHILEAVDTYNPETEAVLLLESGSQVTFFYLKNLPISPPTCYQTICQQGREFPSPSTPLKKETS